MMYPAYMTLADIAEFEIEYNRFLLDTEMNDVQYCDNVQASSEEINQPKEF